MPKDWKGRTGTIIACIIHDHLFIKKVKFIIIHNCRVQIAEHGNIKNSNNFLYINNIKLKISDCLKKYQRISNN